MTQSIATNSLYRATRSLRCGRAYAVAQSRIRGARRCIRHRKQQVFVREKYRQL